MIKKIKIFLNCVLFWPFFWLQSNSTKKHVGGQALIEGVMMRSKQNVAWAVCKIDGTVIVEKMPFISIVKKYKILSLPIIRGFINICESLKIGYKALSRSAEIASDDSSNSSVKQKNNTKDKIIMFFSFLFALFVSIAIFMYLPMFVSQLFFSKTALAFNISAGIIRIFLFLLYLFLISLLKDIRRVFEFHGAEHKAVFAFEDNKELTVENMKPYSTLHPRCGTSFLLMVAIICIFLYSIIDSFFITFIAQYPNVATRFLVHILLFPIITGISYEFLKLSDKFQNIFFVKILILPGLYLQKITTKEPNEKQLEIAATALKASL
jgi:uncharacterized protein YqhQ